MATIKTFYCNSCNKVHLEFNNLGIDFVDEDELVEFSNYLKAIDSEYYYHLNEYSEYHRKIIIPINKKGLKILLNKEEINILIGAINDFVNSSTQWDNLIEAFKQAEI
ncbi:hypothetical protein EMN47_05185 [Prolixibacteraceae bacterium JC049]|nr:hypothetical protein [Prolixibacteraceae bacterium JC049]